MRSYILFIVSLICYIFLSPIQIAQSQSSATSILSQGRIVYSEPYGLVLKYATDFEDAVKVDSTHLYLPIEHKFNFQGGGGAQMWVEDTFAHSGSRSIGMELTDISKSRRNAFVIFNMQDLVGDEVYVSVWHYLPSDWALHSSVGYNWYNIFRLFCEYTDIYAPCIRIRINQPDINELVFDVAVGGRRADNTQYEISKIRDFPLPRGRWFNIRYYMLRHETNGILKVWIDDTIILDVEGISTKTVNDWFLEPAKIYYNTQDTENHQLWVDDLEIYGPP